MPKTLSASLKKAKQEATEELLRRSRELYHLYATADSLSEITGLPIDPDEDSINQKWEAFAQANDQYDLIVTQL